MKNKLTLQPKKAFTLVELIVVVTILAIIWTIWFVSYTDYLSWVRDTNRTVQLESIWDWLKLSLTRWRLPIPDDYIEVKTSWDTIAYQGYAWEEVLKKIKYDKEGKDPLDNTYFSYYATDNRKNFQLMALLEETNETVSLFKGEVLSNDIDYADRQVKVSWKKLWILTGGWDNLNVPVQEIWEIKDNWELDIATTGEEYISHIDDIDKISWSWSELIKSIYNSGCKRILESSLDNWDWIYKINPAGTEEFEVYCDMSTDWGGWTKIEYSEDLEFKNYFSDGVDTWRYLNENFKLKLTKQRILDIQSISNEGKQLYIGDCYDIVHYYFSNGDNYNYVFGFKFLNEEETNFGEEVYNTDIQVLQDDCKYNDNVNRQTIFEINDIRVPLINVKSLDNGQAYEKFGSLLTQNPAWLR